MNFRDRIRSEYQIYTKKKNCTTSTPTTATMASTKSGHMNVETMLIRYDTLFNIDTYSEAPRVTVDDMVFAHMAKSPPPGQESKHEKSFSLYLYRKQTLELEGIDDLGIITVAL